MPSSARHTVTNRPQQDQTVWKAGAPPPLAPGAGVLSSPGVGSDWKPPVKLFGPWVDTFVLVDRDRRGLFDSLSHSVLPFNFVANEPQSLDRLKDAVVKAVLESGRSVSIKWICGDGLEAIAELDDRIGVFFYRGDSSEGSDLWWLFHTEQEMESDADGWEQEDEEDEDFGETLGLHGLFHEVLNRLADGALLVTDGSKGDGDGTISPADPNSYSQISAFRGRRDIIPADAMNQAESFRGPLGHTFECVGCINQMRRYDKGPVLIWQVGSP